MYSSVRPRTAEENAAVDFLLEIGRICRFTATLRASSARRRESVECLGVEEDESDAYSQRDSCKDVDAQEMSERDGDDNNGGPCRQPTTWLVNKESKWYSTLTTY